MSRKSTLTIDKYIENNAKKVKFKEPVKPKSLPCMTPYQLNQFFEQRRFKILRGEIVDDPNIPCVFK